MTWEVSETLYFVSDLDAALAHYTERIGLELLDKQEWGFAMLRVDATHKLGLMAASAWDPKWQPGAPLPATRLALQTDDLVAEVERLRAAGCSVDEVKGEPGTMRGLTFRDQDGNPFLLWEAGSA